MKWWLWIPIVLAALIASAWIVGTLLPREHSATCSVRLRASPRTLYDAIVDVGRATQWRTDLKKLEVLAPRDGKPAWIEESSWGTLTYVREVDEPEQRVVTRIANDDLPYGGTWTYRLAREGEVTRLSITEDGFVEPAFFRFMSKVFFGHHATLESYLKALAEHVGEEAILERG
jgi:hypothetical protein